VGKVIATYLVRITLREPDLTDAPPPGGDMYPPDPRDVPTNEALASRVTSALVDLPFVAHATSERTDR
jgi:hypothetical protein